MPQALQHARFSVIRIVPSARLGLLLLHPQESFHVREIARQTETNAGTLHKERTRLAQAGLLQRKRVGNRLRYGADRQCPVFEEMASILRKTSGLADVLLDAMSPLARRIKVALIFGSIARGEGRTGSDVDILLVGEIGFAEAVKALHATQEKIGREINPLVMSPEELRRKILGGDGFLRDVLAKDKLFLVGDENELGKLAGDQAAGQA
ncbi:nucleotidyltransferase domain-containing protein [Accumulibacter sp.]|uniref:nucleotidyltransferase domain-containing protein n=1 Tax=Accumulibacter sp. TaxID=2053492 RepID=UPI003440B6CF